MIVLVCGSRNWADESRIADRLAEFAVEDEVVVLHGDARGADRMAARIAWRYGFAVRAFPADWSRYGRRAGVVRNLAMLDERPDIVLAFQLNGSSGTQHTIDVARARGIPVEVFS